MIEVTDAQKQIVRNTFATVTDANRLAALFYNNLFELDPSTEQLFSGNMTEQRTKLIQTLSVVVNSLNDLSSIVPVIHALGQRHTSYGVTAAHWDSAGAALLQTLEEVFGEAFTVDVRAAWASTYTLIAQTALESASP
jgi:nitric oxide dioxygenase